MKYASILLLFFLLSCIKEPVTLSSNIFVNTTSHSIKVNTYYSGSVITGSSFYLSPNESKTVQTNNDRGIGSGITFGRGIQFADSIEVVFDDSIRMAHYKPTLIGSNIHFYPYQSHRNIYNDTSYVSDLTKNVKYRREWNFRYAFTEQDYLDAQ